MDNDRPELAGWMRLLLVLALAAICSAVVIGITDALRSATHGGTRPAAADR